MNDKVFAPTAVTLDSNGLVHTVPDPVARREGEESVCSVILPPSFRSTSWMLALCGLIFSLTGCVVPGPYGLPVVVFPQAVVVSPGVVNPGDYGTPAGYYYRNYPVYYYNGRSCYYANGNRYWYGRGGHYGHRNYYSTVNHRNRGYHDNRY